MQRVEVDLRRVREELEMERMMDQHPGYDKKGRTLLRRTYSTLEAEQNL
jgi:hypothetical protein